MRVNPRPFLVTALIVASAFIGLRPVAGTIHEHQVCNENTSEAPYISDGVDAAGEAWLRSPERRAIFVDGCLAQMLRHRTWYGYWQDQPPSDREGD